MPSARAAWPASRLGDLVESHSSTWSPMVAILAMGIGYFTPPLGIGYYTACVFANVSPSRGLHAMTIYAAALFVGLCLVAAIPWISIGFLK